MLLPWIVAAFTLEIESTFYLGKINGSIWIKPNRFNLVRHDNGTRTPFIEIRFERERRLNLCVRVGNFVVKEVLK